MSLYSLYSILFLYFILFLSILLSAAKLRKFFDFDHFWLEKRQPNRQMACSKDTEGNLTKCQSY